MGIYTVGSQAPSPFLSFSHPFIPVDVRIEDSYTMAIHRWKRPCSRQSIIKIPEIHLLLGFEESC